MLLSCRCVVTKVLWLVNEFLSFLPSLSALGPVRDRVGGERARAVGGRSHVRRRDVAQLRALLDLDGRLVRQL